MIPTELQQLWKEVTNAQVKEEHNSSNNGHRGLDLSSPALPKNPILNQHTSTNGQYMSHKREGWAPLSATPFTHFLYILFLFACVSQRENEGHLSFFKSTFFYVVWNPELTIKLVSYLYLKLTEMSP